MPVESVGQILKITFFVFFECMIIILAITSICLFMYGLKSRNIKYITSKICNKEYYKCSNKDLDRQLLKVFKEVGEYNEKILDKEHTLYNYAVKITLIEVIFVGINLIIQMI
ncbi:MAG: hypothetical protein IKE91_02640 [Clostridia bacterium]|nr:hypothetical protein [Clostridia bacterium]